MRSIQSLIVVASLGFLMSGCATSTFVEKDNSIDFTRYRSFAWVDDKADSSRVPISDLQQASLREAVNEELIKSNWREDKKNPDVILKHDILVEKTTKESSNPVYSQGFTRRFYNPYTRRFSYIYYPSQFMGYRSNEYQTREGTLTISMIDAKTDKVVWQGWTTDEVSNRNLTSKEIRHSVKSIFSKFDIAKN